MTIAAHPSLAAPTRLGLRISARRSALVGWCLLLLVAAIWIASGALSYPVALAAMALLAGVAAVAGLRYPLLGVLGIGMLCGFDAVLGPLFEGGLWRWNTLTYWLILVSMLFAPMLLRQRDLQTGLLWLLLGWLGLGLLISADRASGLQHISGLFAVVGLSAYFLRAARVPGVWYWVGILVATSTAAGALAFLVAQDRMPAVNANVWSDLPLAGVHAACLGFAGCSGRLRRQLLLGALAVINTMVVFLSASRGGILLALVALAAMVFMTASVWRAAVLVLAFAAIATGIASRFPTLAATATGRLALLVDTSRPVAVRTSARSQIALGGWHLFRSHPVLGVGTGAFLAERAKLRREETGFLRPGQRRSAHAAWVKVLAENGLPGVLLLAAYVASFAVLARKLGNRRLRVLGYGVAATLGLAFGVTEFQSKELWFFTAGAAVLLSAARRPPAVAS